MSERMDKTDKILCVIGQERKILFLFKLFISTSSLLIFNIPLTADINSSPCQTNTQNQQSLLILVHAESTAFPRDDSL